MWRELRVWSGVVLALTVTVATVWLAATGQLVLYIHPRYVVFTVIMAVLALVVGVASLAVRAHDHDAPVRRWEKVLSIGSLSLSALIALSLVVIPPATLTSSTVSQREINSTGVGADVQSLDDAATGPASAFAAFTVLDWASLLTQSSDAAFYEDKPVDVVGFVTADPDDDDVFYVSRFIVTCCAVDAQPVGVPVYSPGWKDSFEIDGWVQVTGHFATNPASSSTAPLALLPDTVETVGTPSEPYLF